MSVPSLVRVSLRLSAVTVAVAAALAGCSDDGGSSSGDPDAAPLPIDAAIDAAGCDPTTALPAQWRPIGMVSAGTIAVTATGAVTAGTIDATAGGTAGAADNPYIYVDLLAGTKLDLTDVQALSSSAWHIALKRSSIKLNGGDSGPGGVQAAAVAAATLAEVTTIPAALTSDDWATSDCMYNATMAGEPLSVMGNWYDYDGGTHTLTPKAEVWVLRIGSEHRKLRLVTYYGDAASPMRGAYYRVEWARL